MRIVEHGIVGLEMSVSVVGKRMVMGRGMGSVRKVSGGLLMLCLLLREKASKRNDVSIDLFLGYRSRFTVVHRHFWCFMLEKGLCSQE